jgi:hypothetical protein
MVAARGNFNEYDGPPRHAGDDFLFGEGDLDLDLVRVLADLITGDNVSLALPQADPDRAATVQYPKIYYDN